MSIASDTRAEYVKKPVSEVHGSGPASFVTTFNKEVVDEWATAGAIAGNYQNAAENSYADAISGLQSLLN